MSYVTVYARRTLNIALQVFFRCRYEVVFVSFSREMKRDYGYSPATSDLKWQLKYGKKIGLPKRMWVKSRLHNVTVSLYEYFSNKYMFIIAFIQVALY